MAYRYVQTEEKGKWVLIPDQDLERIASSMGVVRATILSVSDDLDADGVEPDAVRYLGPLYFDIDTSDLSTAIVSTKELVDKLISLGVSEDGMEIYCSGSKGFHVIVSHKQFLPSGRMVKGLPYTYMEVARELYVHGLDFAVYSGGKGRMFRPPNGKRPDGRYRVRITLVELYNMTPETYLQLVSAPRYKEFPKPNGHRAPALEAVYDRARKRATRNRVNKESALPLDQLIPYAEEPPGCIDLLVKGEVARGINFNQAGFQLASFIARAGVPPYKADSLISQMADAVDSKSYESPAKRKTHLNGLVKYAQAKASVFFSCGTMRGTVSKPPCSDCPLNNKNVSSAGAATEEDQPQAIAKRPDGYYIVNDKSDRRISTFVLEPQEIYLEQGQGGTTRRISTTMDVYQNHTCISRAVMFDESGWRSKSEFLKQLEGIQGVAFLGSDTDVQRIKISVYQHLEEESVEEVISVDAAGIHETTVVGGRRIYTYVEPGLSINTYHIQGTYQLRGRSSPAPMLRQTAKPQPGDLQMREALRQLMGINSPEVIAQLMGWHALCHLKSHIMPAYRQFPIINQWGSAGSGKTMTSSALCLLNGVDYLREADPVVISLTTAFPLIRAVSSTTTIPRILEEFNRSQIKKHGIYELATECIKASWNAHSVPRGVIGRSRADTSTGGLNARVEEITVTSPLIVCSEEPPIKPALQQRMVQIQLTNKSRRGRDKYFYHVVQNKDSILSFARAMTMMALRSQVSWIQDRYMEHFDKIPESINDRPRYSYAMLFVGLDYLEATTESLNLSLTEEIGELRTALLDHLVASADMISTSKHWSTVDQMLTVIGEMAQLAIQASNQSMLIQGRHWLVMEREDALIIDMPIVWGLYRRYAKIAGVENVFDSFAQAEPLLRSEDYYLSDNRVVPSIGTRRLWSFSLSKMAAKGHDVSMFK